jgi:hypothetical protein
MTRVQIAGTQPTLSAALAPGSLKFGCATFRAFWLGELTIRQLAHPRPRRNRPAFDNSRGAIRNAAAHCRTQPCFSTALPISNLRRHYASAKVNDPLVALSARGTGDGEDSAVPADLRGAIGDSLAGAIPVESNPRSSGASTSKAMA